jgi:hypothetical protein
MATFEIQTSQMQRWVKITIADEAVRAEAGALRANKLASAKHKERNMKTSGLGWMPPEAARPMIMNAIRLSRILRGQYLPQSIPGSGDLRICCNRTK